MWFAEGGVQKIGRITTQGIVTEFAVSLPPSEYSSDPAGMTTGPDGNLWFTEFFGSSIASMTTSGLVTHYHLPSNFPTSMPFAITVGSDRSIWFTEWRYALIGRLTVPRTPSQPVPAVSAATLITFAILLACTGLILLRRV
jgi:streptogramin lyase